MNSCRATARTYRWFGLGAWAAPLLLGTMLGGALGCSGGGGTIAITAPAPKVVTGPAAQTILQGQPVTFAVTVNGTAPFTYQWNKDGNALAGATSPVFTIAAVAASDAGSYTVTIGSAGGGATSSAAVLTVTPLPLAPAITAQPSSATVLAGQPAGFTVEASGTAPLTYQWSLGGAAIAGATSPTYAIAAAAAADAGSYTVKVANSVGSVTSAAAVLTVTPLPVAPAITTQPLGATVIAGQPASFTVASSGTAPLTYQWSLGGAALAGATGPTYAIAAAAAADAGSYAVTVTNAVGSVTSASAILIVNPLLVVTGTASQTAADGATATFTAAAAGVAPYSYQWYRGTTALAGATSSSYTTGTLVYATDNGAQFQCKVTDALGRASAGPVVTLTVTALVPTITTAPVAQSVTTGSSATFSVVAFGTPTLTYQWFENAVAVAGATSPSWTLASTSPADNNAAITVKVANGAGSVTSTAVLLGVQAPAVTITTNPQSATVTVPDGTTFSVVATGSNLTYTWKKNGSALGAPSAATYTVPATDLENVADQYACSVTDGSTTATSTAATLTVKAPVPVYAGDPTLNLPGHIYQVLSSWNLTAPADPVLGSFRVGYDSTNLNPAWSATCFFPVLGLFPNARPATYPTDTRITGAVPVQDSDYTGTGFSRGHQTGYADIAQRYGQPGGDSTMYMTNMCPQTQVLNGGTWESLASLLNSTSPPSFTSTFGRVWVYTGPIFANTLVQPIGPRNIPIPSAFYNVVVRETAPGKPVALALIIPHTTTIGGAVTPLAITDCWKYVTSIDRVQALTGLTFFPTPATALPATFTSTADVRGWGSVLENGIGKPNVHMIDPAWDSTFTLGLPLTTVKINSGTAGTPMNFVGQATTSGTGAASTIASTTWTFGDGGTATVPTTTYTYANPGDYTVTFTATDGAGASNSISRVVTVAGSSATAPTLSAITNVSTTDTMPVTVTFTVSDHSTLAGNIVVSATSSNTAVLVNALTVNNANGTCTMLLTPISAGLGVSTVTVTATNGAALTATQTFTFTVTATPQHSIDEGFEAGTKTGYATATVTCDTGAWSMANALLTAVTGSDRGSGLKTVRMGKYSATSPTAITMTWDLPYGAQTVTVNHALYGTDPSSTWALQYSTNQGTSWTTVGSPVTTTSATVTNAAFAVNVNTPIRFQIIRTDTAAARFDLDDFIVTGY